MVMIQDSNVPTAFDKPLRITGDQMKCQRAKEMVMELLASKDNDMVGFDMVCMIDFNLVVFLIPFH
jgi:hypothetical protein